MTELNAKEFEYAAFLNLVRRAVNVHWEANLDAMPSSVRLEKSEYMTTVTAVVEAGGRLAEVTVTESSGSEHLDQAVVAAFEKASPFAEVPEGLVEDGKATLPSMSFTVKLGSMVHGALPAKEEAPAP